MQHTMLQLTKTVRAHTEPVNAMALNDHIAETPLPATPSEPGGTVPAAPNTR